MSDRCDTQKKFNKLFMEFRKNILKHAINFDDLSQMEQEEMVDVNQFFCGLHYLVGLADQADACLKIWESIIHKDRKVGSIAHGGYSNGESGATRPIRSICKSVQKRGCEKSGKIVFFATYLKYEFGITSIILIHFWVTDLTSFLSMLPGSTFFMMSYYQNLVQLLESSSEDFSKFFRGESFYDPSFINRDKCLIKLLEPCDEQAQRMTKQCLEIIFGRLKMVTRQMLHDHLDDGK